MTRKPAIPAKPAWRTTGIASLLPLAQCQKAAQRVVSALVIAEHLPVLDDKTMKAAVSVVAAVIRVELDAIRSFDAKLSQSASRREAIEAKEATEKKLHDWCAGNPRVVGESKAAYARRASAATELATLGRELRWISRRV